MKTVSVAVLAALFAAPLAAQAKDHPAYLHALTDLRHARAHLERPANPVVQWDEQKAIQKIDAAINDIKNAAINDGKDLSDHPPVDAKMDHPGRLRRAIELMKKARKDIEEDEDTLYGDRLRDRAVKHIDEAIHITKVAIGDTSL